MKKYCMLILLFLVVCVGIFYWITRAAEKKGSLSAELKQAKVEIAAKDSKYELRREHEKKREKIYISPNRQRDDVLNLMRAGLY